MNHQIFEKAISNYKDNIYRYAYSMLKNPHDSEDVVQNVYMKLYKEDFEDKDYIKNWLYKVTYHECMNVFRKPWHKVILTNEFLQTSTKDEIEEMTILQQCPKKYQSILFLYYYEGYSQKEIGIMLGLNLDIVKKRMVKGRAWIKNNLEKEVMDDE